MGDTHYLYFHVSFPLKFKLESFLPFLSFLFGEPNFVYIFFFAKTKDDGSWFGRVTSIYTEWNQKLVGSEQRLQR